MAVPSLIYYRKYRVRKGGEVGTEKGFVPFDFEGGINRVRKATGSSYDSFSTIHLSRIRTKYSRIGSVEITHAYDKRRGRGENKFSPGAAIIGPQYGFSAPGVPELEQIVS